MSTGTALAIAVGFGGGVLMWHLTRDQRDARAAPGTPPPEAPSSAPGEPPRVAGPCSLLLDASGLRLDGLKMDVGAAVARCKTNGRASLVVAGAAPAAVHAELVAAMKAAGIPMQVKAV